MFHVELYYFILCGKNKNEVKHCDMIWFWGHIKHTINARKNARVCLRCVINTRFCVIII